jgi:gluconokinase
VNIWDLLFRVAAAKTFDFPCKALAKWLAEAWSSIQNGGANVIIVVMGVTGAGKSTIGTLLAQQLEWEFEDGDQFHPAANVEKMHRGIPLTDEDRRPWLERLREEIECHQARGKNLVLACSALKREYRKTLAVSAAVRFVYLKGTAELIRERLRERHGHFADDKILAGQFADLEEPDGAIVADIGGTPEEIVKEIRQKLGISASSRREVP